MVVLCSLKYMYQKKGKKIAILVCMTIFCKIMGKGIHILILFNLIQF